MNIYDDLQRIFDHFNKQLFNNECQPCLITFQRQANSRSYVSFNRFSKNDKSAFLHELALNPEYFGVKPIIEICMAICHEMCHVIICQRGQDTRRTYHNGHWATLMESIGLQPSNTGRKGGKRTGQKMWEYPMSDGLFVRSCNDLFADGALLQWYDQQFPKNTFQHSVANDKSFVETLLANSGVQESLLQVAIIENHDYDQVLPGTGGKIKSNAGSNREKLNKYKVKYTCKCKQNLWGKSGLQFSCDKCGSEFIEHAPAEVQKHFFNLKQGVIYYDFQKAQSVQYEK